MVPRELATRQLGNELEAAPESSLPTEKQRLIGKQRPQTGLAPLEAAAVTQRPGMVAQHAVKPDSSKLRMAEDQNRADSPKSKGGSRSAKGVIALLLLAGAGGLIYLLFPSLSSRFAAPVTSSPGGLESLNGDDLETAKTAETAANPAASVPIDLSEGAYVRIRNASITQPNTPANPPAAANDVTATPGISDSTELPAERPTQILLYPNPEDGSLPNAVPFTIPVGAIANIVALEQVDSEQWVQLEVCTVPSGNLSETPVEGSTPVESAEDLAPPIAQNGVPLLSPGTQGWVSSLSLNQFAQGIVDLQPEQRGSCGGE